MDELALAKMHVKPYGDNFTTHSPLENADLDVNHRQPRTFTSPSLLTLLVAASLLAKATAKSHYGGYPAYAPYKPLNYYGPPYYPNVNLGYNVPTNNPHHHHHQLHAPPVNQQQIVNIHERPINRPPHHHHGNDGVDGSGTENFEDINEMNHQHIITTLQRPLENIAEDMLGSEKVYAYALPDQNQTSESSSESETEYPEISQTTLIQETTVSISPIATPPTVDSNETSPKIEKFGAETNINYRRVRPDIIYLKNSPRRTTAKPTRRYSDSSRRRSSTKRGQRRPTTYSSYFDDYEDYATTSRPRNRRRPTQRKSSSKRRTGGTTFAYDEYDYNSLESTTRINNRGPSRNKRRPVKNNHRRRPADDSRDSQYYSMEDDYYKDDDYSGYDDVDLAPRQGTTTSTTTESTTSETTTQSSTTTTTESTTTSTTTFTPPTSGSSGTTEPTTSRPGGNNNATGPGGYGYGPGSGNDNISITYGPPGQHGPPGYANYDYANAPSGAGYGPSQGNDNISITYGPPTLQQRLDYVAPLLDAWYAQYSAKNAVVRRIQELLHQNTQAQPQQQDNYAYNDNVY